MRYVIRIWFLFNFFLTNLYISVSFIFKRVLCTYRNQSWTDAVVIKEILDKGKMKRERSRERNRELDIQTDKRLLEKFSM